MFCNINIFITIIIDNTYCTLYDRAMTNTNELVSLAPALVSEAILRTNENKERFDLIEKKEYEEEIVSELINQLPQSDDDREGWIDSLAIAIIGYRGALPSDLSNIEKQNQEISEDLQSQLEDDFFRWGDTWKKRPIEGQLERTKARFKDYIDQYENGCHQLFPWLKVMGGEIINLVRIDLRDIEDYKKA